MTLVVRNGAIIDGRGSEPRVGSLVIQGEHITCWREHSDGSQRRVLMAAQHLIHLVVQFFMKE